VKFGIIVKNDGLFIQQAGTKGKNFKLLPIACLIQQLDVFGTKLKVCRMLQVFKLLNAGHTGNRCGNRWSGDQPGNGYTRGLATLAFSYLI